MTEPSSSSKVRPVVGCGLLALGVAVFAVRLLHEGTYAVPRGANLFGGLGALLLGGLLVWPATPRWLGWLVLAAAPVVLFSGLYATMAELEEVVSLYATDSAGIPAELRLWIVDREDGEWVGMPRWKSIEHSLDGARVQLLRNGKTRAWCQCFTRTARPSKRSTHSRSRSTRWPVVPLRSVFTPARPGKPPSPCASIRARAGERHQLLPLHPGITLRTARDGLRKWNFPDEVSAQRRGRSTSATTSHPVL